MKKQDANRNHNWPDADLYMHCISAIRLAHRDTQHFQGYGYDLDRLKGFKGKVDKFRDLPDDDELVGDQMIATEKKNKSRDKLKNSIRSLMTRVAMKFSNRTGRYRKFGTSKLGDMTDSQLIFCGRRVVRVARQQIDWLSEAGVNENTLSRIVEANQEFERLTNLQIDRVSERDIAVERRVDDGNGIYEELVILCNIGKDVWAEKDREKYDQYCLYESNNEYKKELATRKEK